MGRGTGDDGSERPKSSQTDISAANAFEEKRERWKVRDFLRFTTSHNIYFKKIHQV